MIKQFLNISFTATESQSEAHQYLSRLLKEGVKKEVDIDVDAYEIKLPSFYDKVKYERSVNFHNHRIQIISFIPFVSKMHFCSFLHKNCLCLLHMEKVAFKKA